MGFVRRALFPPLLLLALASMLLISAVGCGGSSGTSRPPEEMVVEGALDAALSGERAEFVSFVAPSFLAQVRAEMPDATDETLGGVLIAGFLEDIPFEGVVDIEYDAKVNGDRASVYIWGTFLDAGGEEMSISEAEALRVPLIREGGSWYLDLLDL